MSFEEILNDKTIKPKEKTQLLADWISNNTKEVNALLLYSAKSKDAIKGTCIEAFEMVTKNKPEIISSSAFLFFVEALKDKAPRVKWEAARVIGNVASHHQKNLKEATINLLSNASHTGTVVRWSAAYALGEIIKLKTSINKTLVPKINGILETEEKNSIKKIYLSAIKKASD